MRRALHRKWVILLQGGVQEFLAARLHNVFGQNLDMGELVRRSRAAILDTVEVGPLHPPF